MVLEAANILNLTYFYSTNLYFLPRMDNSCILPSCYLPPVPYFSVINAAGEAVQIERYEHFPKQTYRNRTSIYSANGKLDLIIPVQHGSKNHTAMKDVRISNEANWQRLHWTSIQTAYRSSAYFEYYEDDFAPFYHQPFEWLFDFNEAQLGVLLRLLKLDKRMVHTTGYRDDYPYGTDFRQRFHPKRDPSYKGTGYHQVFASKHGFIANLSIIDLLFNQGPQSKSYLSE